jgi:hypothetical protein
MAQSKKPKKTTKSAATKPPKVTEKTPVYNGPRKLKETPKRTLFRRKEKPPRVEHAPLPSSFRIFWHALEIINEHYRLFFGIVIVYAMVNTVLVRGFATGVDVSSIKNDVSGAFHGDAKAAGTSFTLFVYLLGGTGNSANASAGAYQSFLIIITSLVIIYALRQIYAGVIPTIRESYYKACYPLVTVFLVMIVVAVQIIPFAIGAAVFSAIIGGGIALTIVEQIGTGVLCLGLIILSLRWISTSLFALYIVTLPDMTPMKALRSAKDLVRYRRLEVSRKILFLPIAVLVCFALVMTPIILFFTPASAYAFFILTSIGLMIIHSYMYTFYRELL